MVPRHTKRAKRHNTEHVQLISVLMQKYKISENFMLNRSKVEFVGLKVEKKPQLRLVLLNMIEP
jgi:hypothetical protein